MLASSLRDLMREQHSFTSASPFQIARKLVLDEGWQGGVGGGGWFVLYQLEKQRTGTDLAHLRSYLIFVIFFTQSNFLENKIYTKKRQFFALNL